MNRKEIYRYDFSGDCLNSEYTVETVSVGIFQWLPTADGKRLKKGKVVYRVKGPAHKKELIASRAAYLCDQYDRGVSMVNKSETIK